MVCVCVCVCVCVSLHGFHACLPFKPQTVFFITCGRAMAVLDPILINTKVFVTVITSHECNKGIGDKLL